MDKFIFTDKGLEYAAKTATGSVLMFTKGKFGDGTVSGDASKLTDLVKPLGKLQISKNTHEEHQVKIETQFTNTVGDSTLSEFHLKEIGLFAKLQTADGADDPKYPETLVCYAYAEGSDIGDYIPATPTEFIINWAFSVSNADNVKITVGLDAFALQADLDSLEEELKKHKEAKVLDHLDGSVTTAKIKNRAVTEDKIAGGAVTHVKLAENSVWEAQLGRLAVTNDKIANDAVTYNKITNGAVINTKIADGAVTEAKIAGGAITHVKLAENSVWEAQLGRLAVTNDKIANDAVTYNKIANGAVINTKIADGAVTEAKIAGGAITHVKLAENSVWEAHLGSHSVTNTKIANGAVTAQKLDSELNKKLNRLEMTPTVNSLEFSTAFGVEAFAKIINPTLCAVADVMFCRHYKTGKSVCGRAKFQMHPSETAEEENGSIVISDVVGMTQNLGNNHFGTFFIVKHTDGTYYLAYDNVIGSNDEILDYGIFGLNIEAITPIHLSTSSYKNIVQSEAISVKQ